MLFGILLSERIEVVILGNESVFRWEIGGSVFLVYFLSNWIWIFLVFRVS